MRELGRRVCESPIRPVIKRAARACHPLRAPLNSSNQRVGASITVGWAESQAAARYFAFLRFVT